MSHHRNTSPPPPKSPDALEPQRVGRTLSNLIRGMIGDIPDPVPLKVWEEIVEGDENGLLVSVTAPSSSSSSSESSPHKIRKGKMLKESRSKSVKSPEPVMDTDDVFKEDSPPRPRTAVINKSITLSRIRTGSDEKSLPHRKSMFVISSEPNATEKISEVMDISGPKKEEFDWVVRRNKAVRTTRRGNKSRPAKKDQNVMPDLSYSSFEVSLQCKCLYNMWAVTITTTIIIMYFY